MKGRKFVVAKRFQGEPKEGDVELKEETLRALKEGDVLLEGVAWSVDPYMRMAANNAPIGGVVPGGSVFRVAESQNPNYPVGTLVVAYLGWTEKAVINPDTLPPNVYAGISSPALYKAPDTGSLPTSLTVGTLGMPGATAYFGFLEICKPKAGETVLVTGAAGAVGSLVGQIAKIKGCTVIGFAGTDDKCRFLKEELGFDFAFNYKTTKDVNEVLKKAAPKGIDCFFDNVGGDLTTQVILNHLNIFGRMSICGSISRYNRESPDLPPCVELYGVILHKQLLVEGFIVNRWYDQFQSGWSQMKEWIEQGKLKYREHVSDGFETMYDTFRGMLKGQNTGKAVIRAAAQQDTKM